MHISWRSRPAGRPIWILSLIMSIAFLIPHRATAANNFVYTLTTLRQPYKITSTGWMVGSSRSKSTCFGGATSTSQTIPLVFDENGKRYRPGCDSAIFDDSQLYRSITSVNESGWAIGVAISSGAYRHKDASKVFKSFLSRGDTVAFFGTFSTNSKTNFQDINNVGKIAGSELISTSDTTEEVHAVLFNQNVTSFQHIGVLSGSNLSFAYGINNGGTVVGASRDTLVGFLPFIWNGSGDPSQLDLLSGTTVGYAYEISDNGVAVGVSGNWAVRWRGAAGVEKLEVWPGATSSVAYDVNSQGEIVGQIRDSQGRHGVLWLQTPNYGLPAGAHKLTDIVLHNDGFFIEVATSISDLGLIVGQAGFDGANTASGVVLQEAFIVNSTGDGSDADLTDGTCKTASGDCTLRAAIEQANASARKSSAIYFEILSVGGGEPVVELQSQLPAVLSRTIIDASSQPGSNRVALSGSSIVEPSANGLTLAGFDVAFRSLTIGKFSGNGIIVANSPENPHDAPGGVIENCRIGIGPNDDNSWGNSLNGISVPLGFFDRISIGEHDAFALIPAISSSSDVQGNVIAYNGEAGVFLESPAGLMGNSIHDNGGLGIDIAPVGIRPNVTDTTDREINLNHPALDSVVLSGGQVTVYGFVESTEAGFPGEFVFIVEVFVNAECDESGFGEGLMSVARDSLDLADSRKGRFALTFPKPVLGQWFVTATSSSSGITSEFSPCIGVISDLLVNTVADGVDTNPGDGVCNTGNMTASGEIECSLRAAIMEANALSGIDIIVFDIPGAGVATPEISVNSELPEITDIITIDGSSQPNSHQVGIDGSNATSGDGLRISAGFSEVYSLMINNFNGNGISILTGDSNLIDGVYVGVGPDGEESRGNTGSGIKVVNSSGNWFGADPGSFFSSGNRIGHNEGSGISISNGDSNTIFENTIFSNGKAGVLIESGVSNRISRNSIFSNGGLGIDLGPPGVTRNDSLDLDDGANHLINQPFIDSVKTSRPLVGLPEVSIWGIVLASPMTEYKIEIFKSSECDTSFFGEGEKVSGSTTTTTDESGLAEYVVISNLFTLEENEFLSATATDNEGNTSEFSLCWPQIKKIKLLDADSAAIKLQTFSLSFANYDPPVHSEDFIMEVSTDGNGIIDITEMYSSGFFVTGDSIKISKILQGDRLVRRDTTVTLDNGKFDPLFFGLEYDTLNRDTLQSIVLDHSTFGFDLDIVIEWDATRAYIDSVKSGIRQMANYLYDVTDGQVQIGYVTIREDFDLEGIQNSGSLINPDILIVANNVEVPNYDERRKRITIPRRIFLHSDGDISHQSATEDLTNPAAVKHWSNLASLVARRYLGFLSENRTRPRSNGCNTKREMGLMSWPYPQFNDNGANSEMSWSLNYQNLGCRTTSQYRKRSMSCWEYFDITFERRYPGFDGILAPVITPEERDLPPGDKYFFGPNDRDLVNGGVNLQYDAGSRVFFVGNNDPSPSFDEFWKFTHANGFPMRNTEVYTSQSDIFFGERIIDQGKTDFRGGLWLVGVKDGDEVVAAGGRFVSTIDSSGVAQTVTRWVNGRAVVTTATARSSSPQARTVIMKPISGDFPLIVSAELDSSTFAYNMKASRMFDSLPTLRYFKDSLGRVTDTFTLNGLRYQSTVDFGQSTQGRITVEAPDDSLELFFFNTKFRISQGVDSTSENLALSADASAEFEIDSVNGNIKRMLVISSLFPTIRNTLDDKSIQIGPTYALSVYPSTTLQGENILVITYSENDSDTVSGAFNGPETIKIHSWDDLTRRWNPIESEVDTVNNQVSAMVTETGVYALFTTDIQTDVDDDELVTLPKRFRIQQNFPNPFNPTTIISYSLPTKAEVTIVIYNVVGQKVKVFDQGQQSAGEYSVTWNATDTRGKEVASGMYFYKVTAGDFSASRKMVLLK